VIAVTASTRLILRSLTEGGVSKDGAVTDLGFT